MPNHWYPNGAGVSIDTMDGHLDVSDVSWQRVAPCGCVSGVTMGAVAGEVIVTADQAQGQFCENRYEVERDKGRGFTYRPREHKAACEEMKRDCPHDPKWGYAKPPKPEGYTWAAVDALGSKPKYTHLIPLAAVERAKARDYSVLDVAPLCGGKSAFHWHDDPHATWGKVECKRCIAAAKKMPAEVSA